MKTWIRLLAFVCEICPLCITSRRFPDSKFASGMKRLEKFCPFCNAHKMLKQKEHAQEE
ncbi:MAG: hypothetical protein WC331_08680 [Candidatus Omnitrophota bacterium]